MTQAHVLRYGIAGLMSAGIAAAAGLPAAGRTAELRYFQHSGWLIKTATHVLVFDYVEAIPGGTRLSAAVALKPEDLGGLHFGQGPFGAEKKP